MTARNFMRRVSPCRPIRAQVGLSGAETGLKRGSSWLQTLGPVGHAKAMLLSWLAQTQVRLKWGSSWFKH